MNWVPLPVTIVGAISRGVCIRLTILHSAKKTNDLGNLAGESCFDANFYAHLVLPVSGMKTGGVNPPHAISS